MTRRRWIADEFSDERAALTGAHAAHLSRTLRARVGQEFDIACGEQLRRGVVASVSDERVEFTLGEQLPASMVVPITLLLAIFKFDRMEWAIEKCTELNVTSIVPVIAQRTEKHLAAAAGKRVERWRLIAREAAEQSRRISPPEISEPLKLKEALGNCMFASPVELPSGRESLASQPRGGIGFSPGREPWVGQNLYPSPVGTAQGSEASHDLRIVLAETEREATLNEVLSEHNDLQSLALAIGPEGGWTADELQTFERSGWIAASLGDTILRAETAAIAALAVGRARV